MRLASPETLAVAALLDSPAIWSAAVTHDMSGLTAVARFLLAVPVAAIMLSLLERATETYGQQARTIRAKAERLDEAGGDEPNDNG